jgi:hypothetical protein
MDTLVAAFDPGLTNLGVWSGFSKGTGLPQTQYIDKINIKLSNRSIAEAAVDAILELPWLYMVSNAVVETQEVKNTPGRIVATAIYGALRGKGIKTTFSGSYMKNDVIDLIAEKYSIPLEEKPSRVDVPFRCKRMSMMHAINKRNSKRVVDAILHANGDVANLAKLANARDIRGRKKSDDMCDAMLLGIGKIMELQKICEK